MIDNHITFKPVYYYAAALYLWIKIKDEKLAQSIHKNTFKETEVIKVLNDIIANYRKAPGIVKPLLYCLLKTSCNDNLQKEILATTNKLGLNEEWVKEVFETKRNSIDRSECVVHQVAKSIDGASGLSKLPN